MMTGTFAFWVVFNTSADLQDLVVTLSARNRADPHHVRDVKPHEAALSVGDVTPRERQMHTPILRDTS
jgi:hypothetical protein